MQNFLVSFHSENAEVIHRLLVKNDDQGLVSEIAKGHFRDKGIPHEELLFFTVEAYGEAKIEGVEEIT